MKYVYGPVPSRRLGQSLGIDPVPFKTCNWNCVYCQLGRTSSLQARRAHFFPAEEIVAEVAAVLANPGVGTIDWVTFAGSGEPTLHAGLGAMIRQIKALTAIPVAVITNGGLLVDPDVRRELQPADLVMPTVSAGTETLYQILHRPDPSLDFHALMRGLTAFRKVFCGRLWVEVMLLHGVNDSVEALTDLARVLARVRPDEIHLTTTTRPPCVDWVRPVSPEAIETARRLLEPVARVVVPAPTELKLTGQEDVVQAIINLITRHPVREDELIHALDRWQPGQVRETLDALEKSGQARVVLQDRVRCWSGAAARYVASSHPAHPSPAAPESPESPGKTRDGSDSRPG